jgi:hypothetical protein
MVSAFFALSLMKSISDMLGIGTTKNISRSQRRGAIMIIGMLAVADKSILDDHIDLMLKVGLGKMGIVRRPRPYPRIYLTLPYSIE